MDNWIRVGEALGSFSPFLAFLAAVIGGYIGLRRYRYSLKLRAGDLLMRMEEEFREILPVCVVWEAGDSYKKQVEPVLARYLAEQPLSAADLAMLADIDRCLRFFYLCTVLHRDLGIDQAVVARSYYWWASQLRNSDERPLFCQYIASNYKRLHQWLEDHQGHFDRYRKHGVWPQ